METGKINASNRKIGTMVERVFDSKYGVLLTMANTVGANVRVLDIQKVLEGFSVAFFVHIDREEIETADIELMWPGVDLTMVNQAVADAVIDEAIRHYEFDPLEELREMFLHFDYYYEEKVNQIFRMFETLERINSTSRLRAKM